MLPFFTSCELFENDSPVSGGYEAYNLDSYYSHGYYNLYLHHDYTYEMYGDSVFNSNTLKWEYWGVRGTYTLKNVKGNTGTITLYPDDSYNSKDLGFVPYATFNTKYTLTDKELIFHEYNKDIHWSLFVKF